ncbi:hypothetical protein C8A05DRAFT_36937 [Staphylotrichum tortipilum]|uniref:DUF7924 domain-containing protein n=1 Tax=Staphylotrichum tortipilum TaxID=2831512 RepID=A0AAN6MEP1_9PEZI|nr:hypothetical protein C8A05DRAFT_36937 [Staphylotrichum longicolle]
MLHAQWRDNFHGDLNIPYPPSVLIATAPDYSVGFKRDAFTEDQLAKLSPFIGDFIAGDQSLFMATYYIYFPFLTCEVKCGAAALDIADRQNAYTMTLAVRGIVELFRAVDREDEVNQPEDPRLLRLARPRSVRIYGHYPVIAEKDINYYRHPIHDFFLHRARRKGQMDSISIHAPWGPLNDMKPE